MLSACLKLKDEIRTQEQKHMIVLLQQLLIQNLTVQQLPLYQQRLSSAMTRPAFIPFCKMELTMEFITTSLTCPQIIYI